ncbi:MAG: phosphotransferase [archaeon]
MKNRFNQISILEKKVKKTYFSYDNLMNEVTYNKKFSKYFKVPKIYEIYGLTMEMEKIENRLLKNEIKQRRDFGLIKYLFDKKKYIKNKEGKDLTHGDFRLPHIFISDKSDFALIDFEYSHYGDINFDLAYFYFSLLQNRFIKESESLKELVKKEYNYKKFLKSGKYYCERIKENPLIKNKRIWNQNIKEINKDLNLY